MTDTERKDASRAAFLKALDAAYDCLQESRKFDFSCYTQDDAEALFARFLETYCLEILATWDPELIRTVGVPSAPENIHA